MTIVLLLSGAAAVGAEKPNILVVLAMLVDRQYTEADMTVPIEQWYLTVEDTNYAIQFLDEEVVGKAEKKPFFMYYATHAPHWPLQAPRADVDRYLKVFASRDEKNYYQLALAIHTAMVYRMDQELGRLFISVVTTAAQLQRRGTCEQSV